MTCHHANLIGGLFNIYNPLKWLGDDYLRMWFLFSPSVLPAACQCSETLARKKDRNTCSNQLLLLKNRSNNDKEGFAISFCLCSSGKWGEDQTLSLIWPPPSWLNMSVFKWHLWHSRRQGCWFVSCRNVSQTFLGYRLGRSFSKTCNDIWNFLWKLMWSFIWKSKALPQALRSPLLVNWC